MFPKFELGYTAFGLVLAYMLLAFNIWICSNLIKKNAIGFSWLRISNLIFLRFLFDFFIQITAITTNSKNEHNITIPKIGKNLFQEKISQKSILFD